MPIRVEATGRVTGAPSPVSTDDGVLTVFVFNPFPESAPAGIAHAYEVRCRDDRLVGDVLRHGLVGASVAVSGELVMTAVSGPVEDELCAVQVSIEAEDVSFGSRGGPVSRPTA
jgi:hypothetical protein